MAAPPLRDRLVTQLFILFVLVIAFCLVGSVFFSGRPIRHFYEDSQTESLLAMNRLVQGQFSSLLLAESRWTEAETLARRLGQDSGVRVTVLLPDGTVVADSEEEPARMENHRDRPEIIQAMAADHGASIRFSDTVQTRMLYVATPLQHGNRIAGVLRLAQPLSSIDRQMTNFHGLMLRSGLIAALFAVLLSLLIIRRVTRPVEAMQRTAERFARGDFSQPLRLDKPAEFAGLASSLNHMSRQLDQRIREITRQRNEMEAILASMREGVLAVDLEERIIRINKAAEGILGVRAERSVGRLVQEVLRHADLQRFIRGALAGEPMDPQENLFRWEEERLLQAEPSPLLDENGNRHGLLIVINDVTRLHRLENVRREFVANVSHELRTPVTSIKGFVETLREGAIDDRETALRFLGILQRQADRLSAIIEDLLSLSRIEREAESKSVALEPCTLRPLLESAVSNHQSVLEGKQIAVALECPEELTVQANRLLLEQAVGNLIDNAVKYSDEGGPLLISASREEDRARIDVVDGGCGIAPQHHDRLFERFYRVDTARSRELGGTGLGLSIVKHIALAHGGSVSVRSQTGKGSTFTLFVPLAARASAAPVTNGASGQPSQSTSPGNPGGLSS